MRDCLRLTPSIRYAVLDARYALELAGCMADEMTDQVRGAGWWKMAKNRGAATSLALHDLSAVFGPKIVGVAEAR